MLLRCWDNRNTQGHSLHLSCCIHSVINHLGNTDLTGNLESSLLPLGYLFYTGTNNAKIEIIMQTEGWFTCFIFLVSFVLSEALIRTACFFGNKIQQRHTTETFWVENPKGINTTSVSSNMLYNGLNSSKLIQSAHVHIQTAYILPV